MWGAKSLAVFLILSMLSACAGARAPDRDLADHDQQSLRDTENASLSERYAEGAEAGTAGDVDLERALLERSAAAAARHGPRHRSAREARYHREPSPSEKYAAEVALLVTAQIFVCSFVVVILDGHCSFHTSTGYYY